MQNTLNQHQWLLQLTLIYIMDCRLFDAMLPFDYFSSVATKATDFNVEISQWIPFIDTTAIFKIIICIFAAMLLGWGGGAG